MMSYLTCRTQHSDKPIYQISVLSKRMMCGWNFYEWLIANILMSDSEKDFGQPVDT